MTHRTEMSYEVDMTPELQVATDADERFRAEISVFLCNVSDDSHETGEVALVANATVVIAC